KASLSGENPTAIVSGQNHPEGLVTDGTSVYWGTHDAVMKSSLTGGNVTTLASGRQTWTAVQAMALDSASVYWVSVCCTNGVVMKVSKTGGDITPIATNLPPGQEGPDHIAVDGSGIYWTNGTGTVVRTSLTGENFTVLASGLKFPGPIALDAKSI